MELFKPNASEDLAIDLVKKLYGLDVLSIKRMDSYDDQNFQILVLPFHKNPHLNKVEEHGYTLKITNTQKSAVVGHFDVMHAIMVHQHKKGIRMPLPLKNINGETWSLEKVPLLNEENNSTGPKLCGIHILSYIPGSPIESIMETADCITDIYLQWGALLAKFHNAAEDFESPYLEDKEVFWSMEMVPKIKDYVHVLPEDKKDLVNGVLSRYPHEIEPNLHLLPKGIIHGDFNQNNVLVEEESAETGERKFTVNGILDFEDLHKGTYVWDVGVLLAYCIMAYNGKDEQEVAGFALIGYLSIRPLNTLEKTLIKICIECRMCQSLVLSAYSYEQDTSNTYLLNSAKTGWTKLQKIVQMTNEDLQQKWKNVEISYGGDIL